MSDRNELLAYAKFWREMPSDFIPIVELESAKALAEFAAYVLNPPTEVQAAMERIRRLKSLESVDSVYPIPVADSYDPEKIRCLLETKQFMDMLAVVDYFLTLTEPTHD